MLLLPWDCYQIQEVNNYEAQAGRNRFSRLLARGMGQQKKFYIRFLYNGETFLTRSTDAPTAAKAGIIAKKIIDEEDLLSLSL